MLNFHILEIKYRLIYFFISFLLTFCTLFLYKEIIINNFIFFNLIYTNILESFFSTIQLILFFTIIFNMPTLLYNILNFFKTALNSKEYFYLKKLFIFINFFIFFIIIFIFYFFIPLFLY